MAWDVAGLLMIVFGISMGSKMATYSLGAQDSGKGETAHIREGSKQNHFRKLRIITYPKNKPLFL